MSFHVLYSTPLPHPKQKNANKKALMTDGPFERNETVFYGGGGAGGAGEKIPDSTVFPYKE